MSVDIDDAEVHFIHRIVVFAVFFSEQYNFWSKKNAMQFENLAVTVGENGRQLSFPFIANCRRPFFKLARFWCDHLDMKLDDLQWLQAEHCFNLLLQLLLLCLLSCSKRMLCACVRFALDYLKRSINSKIKGQICFRVV